MMMIGIGFWFIGIPAAFFMRKNPENYGLLPDGNLKKQDSVNTKVYSPRQEPQITLRQAVKLRVFWQLAIATSLGQLVSSTNLFHFDALINFGISIKFAALAAGSVHSQGNERSQGAGTRRTDHQGGQNILGRLLWLGQN